MKKLLLIIPLLLLGWGAKSQNLVGDTYYDAKIKLEKRGLAVREDVKDGMKCLVGISREVIRVYIFENNICTYALISISEMTYLGAVELLKNNGYTQNADGNFISQDGSYISKLEYNSVRQSWSISFSPN